MTEAEHDDRPRTPSLVPTGEPYDLIVIGGGTGGLTLGMMGPRFGLRVAVIEQARTGGDCTWTGCVPSKSLLAAAAVRHEATRAEALGLPASGPPPPVDLSRVLARVHAVQHQIWEADDSPAALRRAGCDVIEGRARFTGPRTLVVGEAATETVIAARHICIASGARAVVPPIPGLDTVSHYTNETLFTEIGALPPRLLVIGGGPVGVELGQAFSRLGSAVTIVEAAPRLLPTGEPALSEELTTALRAEQIEVLCGATVASLARAGDGGIAEISDEHGARQVGFDAVLLAVGQRANVDALGLDLAGVAYNSRGIRVDRRLRTTNRDVSACGDVIDGPRFTHAAAHEAGIVLRNLVAPGSGRVRHDRVPAVTYTDPEIASVGLTETAARAEHSLVTIYRYPIGETDRARVAGRAGGVALLVAAGRSGRLVGAHFAMPHAGEVIHEYALAIEQGVTAREMAERIHAYPTYALGPKYAALGALDAYAERRSVRAVTAAYRWWRRRR